MTFSVLNPSFVDAYTHQHDHDHGDKNIRLMPFVTNEESMVLMIVYFFETQRANITTRVDFVTCQRQCVSVGLYFSQRQSNKKKV